MCVTLCVVCTIAGVCLILCMCVCMHVFIRVCVQPDIALGCMHGACMRVCACNYVMITCASQIQDVLVNDKLPVGILLTEHFDNFENIQNMSLFRDFALPASGIHYWVQTLIYSNRS